MRRAKALEAMPTARHRLSDCGLSGSVYQSCYTASLRKLSADVTRDDDGEAANKKVTFFIGDGCSPSYEEECWFGLRRLLEGSLLVQVAALFSDQFGGAASVVGLDELFPSLVAQLLSLSEDEPYGVRGASLTVALMQKGIPIGAGSIRKNSVASSCASSFSSACVEESDQHAMMEDPTTRTIGTVKMCTDTVTTFELTLSLKERRNLTVSIRNWMANLVGSQQIIVIEPAFALRKRRLYRSS